MDRHGATGTSAKGPILVPNGPTSRQENTFRLLNGPALYVNSNFIGIFKVIMSGAWSAGRSSFLTRALIGVRTSLEGKGGWWPPSLPSQERISKRQKTVNSPTVEGTEIMFWSGQNWSHRGEKSQNFTTTSFFGQKIVNISKTFLARVNTKKEWLAHDDLSNIAHQSWPKVTSLKFERSLKKLFYIFRK